MKSAVLALYGSRIAVVLVAPGQAQPGAGDQLLRDLFARFRPLSIMLVARDDSALNGVRAYAHFRCESHLAHLLTMRDIEWSELPAVELAPLPF